MMKYLSLSVTILLLCSATMLSALLCDNRYMQGDFVYEEVTGGTLLGNEATDDQRFIDPAQPLGTTGTSNTGPGFPIGFDFNFNGYVFDRIAVNANGWISLGQSALGTAAVNIGSTVTYEPLSSTMSITPAQLTNRISAFATNLQAQSGASLRIVVSGNQPYRTCTIQWKNYRRYGNTSGSANFQIRLFETHNSVSMLYGSFTHGFSVSLNNCQVGMRGPDLTDFVNRTTTTDWSATTPGNYNTATCTYAPGIMPASGLTFSYNYPIDWGYDLMGLSIGTPNSTPSLNSLATINVTVRNCGSIAQSGYSVKLMNGTIILTTATGPTIQGFQNVVVPVNYVFTDTGPYTLRADVDALVENIPENDVTPLLDINVQPASTYLSTVGTGEQLAPMPVNAFYHNSLFECLFYPTEINMRGQITGLTFYNRFVDLSAPSFNVKIWLGETTQTDLTASWISSPQLTLVYEGSVTFPIGTNPVSINLTTPFNYSGNNNLVLMVNRTFDSSFYSMSDYFYSQTSATTRSRNVGNDTVTLDPTNPPTAGVTISGQFPKTSFNFTPTPINLTGFVTGSNAPATGLSNASLQLTGPQTYTATTNSFGQFALSGVMPARYYTLTITHPDYLTYTNEMLLGNSSQDLGILVLDEVPYPPANVAAAFNGNNVDISWTNSTGFFLGYRVWRLQPGQEAADSTWVLLTALTNNPQFTDTGLPALPNGFYKWAVKAMFNNNVLSEPAFSNQLQSLFQLGTLTGSVTAPDRTPITGARIAVLSFSTVTDNTGNYSFSAPAGSFDVICSASGHSCQNADSTVINVGQVTALNFVLGPVAPFTDSFESYPDFALSFPPWITLDLDQSGTTAVHAVQFPNDHAALSFIVFNPLNTYPPSGDYFPAHTGVKLLISFDAFSWDTATTNDWLISPLLGTVGSGASVTLWARSGWYDPFDRMRVLISEGSTDISRFTPLSDEPYVIPPTAWTNYTFQVPPAYYNKAIRIAVNNITTDGVALLIDDFYFDPGTPVSNEDQAIPIVSTALQGNYPNPFSGQTTICFSLREKSFVRLEIFNSKGQKVKTLLREDKSAGTHTIFWDGSDANSAPVANGIYFCRLSAAKTSSVIKMMLLR